MTLTDLEDEVALVSRIVGLAEMDPSKSKVPVARVIHRRPNDEAEFFSYAFLTPYGMNRVWVVFPVLSHSHVSMPEAMIMPWLNHLRDKGRLDFRETVFGSEKRFQSWVMSKEREFRSTRFIDHVEPSESLGIGNHDVRLTEDSNGNHGFYCHDCQKWINERHE